MVQALTYVVIKGYRPHSTSVTAFAVPPSPREKALRLRRELTMNTQG